jgi:thiamine biosynthesis lipoprotein
MEQVELTARDRPALYRTSGLGTKAEILVTDVGVLVAAARILNKELERIDQIASRFRADSEISRLRLARGLPVRVSPDLFEAIGVAVAMAEATDGAVDPTVGKALCEIGYDRDFAAISNGVLGRLPSAGPVPGWRSICIDFDQGTIRVPDGVLLDLGATAKALAADRMANAITAQLGCGVLVSLGGDVAVAGSPPPGGFRVGLADACSAGRVDEAVAITSGGLATSGIGTRRWRLGSDEVHHIIDPATGLPAKTAWRTVSVAAATCVEANAAATAAMVKGRKAVEWLSSLQLPARLVGVDDVVCKTGGWPDDDRLDRVPKAGLR